jgi:uncharacterized protein (UPF0332 family)
MTEEERKQYVHYRIETAYKTLEAAKVLADNGYWNSAVNRLYYAALYAVNALLVAKGIETKTHSSTKSMFSLHFIKPGILDKKYGRLFSELLDSRQKGDYEYVFEYEESTVLPLFEPVSEMIEQIQEEINKKS